MKLELPDNNASVLFHMGNALQSIASDLDVAYNNKTPLRVDTSGMTQDEISDSIDKMIDAVAADWKVPVNRLTGNTTDSEQYGKITMSDVTSMVKTSLDEALNRGLIEPTTTMFKGVGSIDAGTDADDIDQIIEANDTIDADGLPWDQRIHSRGKTRLADNTWRTARKPNDKTDEEWAEYVEGVKTELRALMAIPVTVTYDPNEADPFAADDGPFYWEHPESDSYGVVQTREELESYLESDLCCVEITKEMYDKLLSESKNVVVTPPVVDAPVVVTPPVVDAPVVVTPPVIDAPVVVSPPVTTGPTTFPELMKFITVNNKKLTKESVDEALKAQGLASLALLATRPELIPQFHAALVKLL